jgi:phosphate acyltransferase
MRPSIRRIRSIFDYETHGGSLLLGVKGTVIITHGSAKRRMIGFACDVAARTAAARVPELIAEALAADRQRLAELGSADVAPADQEVAS